MYFPILAYNISGNVTSNVTGNVTDHIIPNNINKKHVPYNTSQTHMLVKMMCLHGEPCAHTTTQKGSFWFCNQNPSGNFFCPENENYEKATAAWKSTKQTHPRCEKHNKLAKMHVVKDLLKATYGRPFFVCSNQSKPCSFWIWGDVRPISKPLFSFF